MSNLSGREISELDNKYNQHPWLKGDVNALAIEHGEGIYFGIMMEKNIMICHLN